MVPGHHHHHRRGLTVKYSSQGSYSAWSHSHSSCTHKHTREKHKKWKCIDETQCQLALYLNTHMHSHWPDAVVIRIDITRLVKLSIMQAGAEVGCHTLSGVTQILSSRAKTALLTHSLLLTSCLSARQSAARPVAHTAAGLIHLASSALKFWQKQIRVREQVSTLFFISKK